MKILPGITTLPPLVTGAAAAARWGTNSVLSAGADPGSSGGGGSITVYAGIGTDASVVVGVANTTVYASIGTDVMVVGIDGVLLFILVLVLMLVGLVVSLFMLVGTGSVLLFILVLVLMLWFGSITIYASRYCWCTTIYTSIGSIGSTTIYAGIDNTTIYADIGANASRYW
ncbi:hypothetical protein M0804_011208 [Polistes exclamans]|nr:hypothetical protein M0804_011208 [Polistes exclamans]